MYHLSILHAVCNATETNRTVLRYTDHGAFFKFYFLTLCMRCFSVFSLVLVPRFSLQKSGGHLDLSIQFYIPCVYVCVYGPCASSPPPHPPHTHTRLTTIESVFSSALFAGSFFPQSFTSSHLNIRNAKCSFLCCKQSFHVTVNILSFHADLCTVFLCAVLFTLI